MASEFNVTVAIPVFNGARFLLPAIASIREQTYRDFQLVVVDDGSTDNSADMIRALASEDSRIVPVFRQHGGIAAAMNAALAAAVGRYFAVLDQDDIAHPERIARQVDFLNANAEIAVVGTAWETFGERSKTTLPPTKPSEIAEAMHRFCAVMHPSSMMRTEFLRSVGGYRTALPYAEDVDLWLRILERGKMANLPDTLLRKRVHRHQVTARHRPDRPARIVSGAIAYMSHLSRQHFDSDFVVDRETLLSGALDFFHRFIDEVGERSEAIYHHLNRFVRYVPIEARRMRGPDRLTYRRYLAEQLRSEGLAMAARGAGYVAEFLLFNRFFRPVSLVSNRSQGPAAADRLVGGAIPVVEV